MRHDEFECAGTGTRHHAVPVSREVREPHDGRPTRWRCRFCGQPVDPVSGRVTRLRVVPE